MSGTKNVELLLYRSITSIIEITQNWKSRQQSAKFENEGHTHRQPNRERRGRGAVSRCRCAQQSRALFLSIALFLIT